MKKLLLLASLSLAVTCSAQDGTFIPGHVNRNGVFIPGHFENYDMNGMAPQAPRQMYVAPVEPEGYGRYLAMQYLERQRAIQYRRKSSNLSVDSAIGTLSKAPAVQQGLTYIGGGASAEGGGRSLAISSGRRFSRQIGRQFGHYFRHRRCVGICALLQTLHHPRTLGD